MVSQLINISPKKTNISFLFIPLFFILSACGSGGVDENKVGDPNDVVNTRPTVLIDDPAADSSYELGDTVSFNGSANDAEDGDITSSLVWSSNLDGEFGTGGSVTVSLSAGNHEITLSVTDSNGSGASEKINLSVLDSPENTPPNLTISSPSNNSQADVNTTIIFSAVAEDSEDGNLNSAIVWTSSIDGELAIGGNAELQLSAGQHQITASVEDSEGASDSRMINLSIDTVAENTPPTIQINSPANNSTFESGTQLVLMGTANDAEDGDLSAAITWQSSRDGNLGSGSSQGVSLSDGIHSISATIVDSNGATQFTQITIEMVAEVVNNPPTVQITSPTSGSEFESGTQVTFSATATDVEDGNLNSSIIWASNIDGGLGTGANTNAQLSEGSHIVSATVTDSSGASQTTQINIEITAAENSLPMIEILSPATGATFETGTQISLSGSASDAEDGNVSGQISWSSNLDGALGNGANNTAVLTDGNHNIVATITDSNGATVTAEIAIEVTPAIENSAPEVTITSPTDGGMVEEGESMSLGAEAIDAEDGDISSQVVWRSNIDGALGTGATLTVYLTPGAHLLTAEISDSENETTSVSVNVTINRAPEISIIAPTDGDLINQGDAMVLTAEASDSEDGDLASQIIWRSDIDGDLGTGNNLSVDLSVGSHTLTAEIEDLDGASSAISIDLFVNAAPEISINSPVNGSTIAEGSMTTFTATASDNEDGNLGSSITWSSDIDGNLGTGGSIQFELSTGTHQITASIVDSNDLASTHSIEVQVVIANGAVTLSWTAPTENTDDSELTDLAGFKVYYGEDENNLIESVLVDDPNQLAYVFESLNSNTTYYFAVTAMNSFGVESDLSNTTSKTTGN